MLCSIGAYPFLTILFERWYSDLFLAATFDTFRVYEKAWSQDCIVSFLLLQAFIVVLSLLPDYICVITTFLKTTFRIIEYRDKQSSNGSTYATTYVIEHPKGKSFTNSTVMPTDYVGMHGTQKKKEYNTEPANKHFEALSADALKLKSVDITKPKEALPTVSFVNGNGGPFLGKSICNAQQAQSSKGLEAKSDSRLNASIANILFKNEQNKDHVRNNSNSIDQNSLPLAISNSNSKDELLKDECYDNPSFESSTPVHQSAVLDYMDTSFDTRL